MELLNTLYNLMGLVFVLGTIISMGLSLTMAQINAVKQSFVFSLSNMLHGRIPYPKEHEDNPDQPAKTPSRPDEEAGKAD